VNAFKTIVLSVFLAVFFTFIAITKEYAPTRVQVGQVLNNVTCDEQVTNECLDTFLKSKNNEKRATLSRYELAHDILGNDFITPYDIARARNVFYLSAQLVEFENTLPSREVLKWLKVNNYILIAGPPVSLSLLGVRRQNEALFTYWNGEGWYAMSGEDFSRRDLVTPVWLALRKTPIPGSVDKTWSEQLELLSDSERVPNAAEVAWGLTTYREVRGVYLMGNVWVRVSSVSSSGNRVYVGVFNSIGLSVHDWLDSFHYPFLGLSSVRKSLVSNP